MGDNLTYNEIQSELFKGKRLYDLPLKVVYYARVSTDSDNQLNSLDNQTSYYENFIKENNNWVFVKGYIDEGVSGVSIKNRKEFLSMIEDSKNNQFDLIITKEVSRFARDLEDSIHYIRILKDNNVGILFENQNLNTFDSNSELILNIMFNLAQEESKKLSARIKFGHKEAIKKGHVLGSSNIIGYRKNNCKLEILEDEANFIRKVYKLYATGNYGFGSLSNKLYELGYKNKHGNHYDKDTLKHILSNPKYKGYYRSGEYETLDYRTKKRKRNSADKQIIYKVNETIIPSIVSERLWNKVSKILSKKSKNI